MSDESSVRSALPPGLTRAEAARRLAEVGPNATPDAAVHPVRRMFGKFIAPVPCLLEAAIVLQLILGEYVEAGVIAVLLVFNAVVALIQEGRAQATVEALKSRLALWASVRRDSSWQNVPASQLVPGDIVKMSLGSVVAADVRILSGEVLLDQSMITGESLPIEAAAGVETYASALVRRGEAVAEVTATGTRTKFGRAAELVRTAHVVSAQQKAIFRVVVNLALFNGVVALALLVYAWHIHLPVGEFIPLVLLSVLATVPVALPATFTLATALGSQALTRRGVLPTRLSAVDEAASMDVLCSDKTGTLTRNELAVMAVRAMPGFSESRVLSLAALASSEGGQDPVDQAVRAAAAAATGERPTLISFVPFDPSTKMSEAVIAGEDGSRSRVFKGAFATVARLAQPPASASQVVNELELEGHRVLGVGVEGPDGARLAGLIALSDPPRPEAAGCIAELRRLGIQVVMVTGDAETTAGVIAKKVGITGAVHPGGGVGESAADYQVFAGVLPEDKFKLVQALQRSGHTVGMCGDGANDAPALRQRQIGIAVSSATDVAKSAAGIVLTEPGLAGIVASVHEGRITFQRILTYALRSIVHKARQVLFLALGLWMIGHAVLTPMLMVLSMITGDFLAMSSTTDNVVPSPLPNQWRIDNLTIAGIVMGLFDLAFCAGVLAIGKYDVQLDVPALQTLTLVTLVFNGQAVFYAVRERRRLWSSRPSTIVILASVADLLLIPTLAVNGWLMAPIPITVVAEVALAAMILTFVLDWVKATLFGWLKMA